MVTPVNGSMLFRGRSGRLYSVDIYHSDVIAAAVTFAPNGAAIATSAQYFIPPEDVALEDYSIVTGSTVALGCQMLQNGAPRPGTAMRIANHLNTLAHRPLLSVAFPAGSQIGAQQF